MAGLPPRATVTFTNVRGEVLLTAQADETGALIVAGLPPGTYELTISPIDGGAPIHREVRVLGTAVDPSALALTGSTPQRLVALALLLLAVGALLRRMARRATSTY